MIFSGGSGPRPGLEELVLYYLNKITDSIQSTDPELTLRQKLNSIRRKQHRRQ